MQIFTFRKNS